LEIVRAAARRGWSVTVISGGAPEQPSPAGLALAARTPDSVLVHRFRERDLEPFHRLAPRMDGGFGAVRSIAAEGLALEDPATVVLASGPPFGEFVAAYQLARRWGALLALDYRDEWTESPFGFVRTGRHDRAWEDRCLRAADAVFFTTETQRQHQCDVFKALGASRTFVVPNGWDEEAPLASAGAAFPDPPGGRLRIAYLGFLAEHCEVEEFTATLHTALSGAPSLAAAFELAFIGEKSPAEARILDRFPLPGVVAAHGQIPQATAQSVMRDSAALLLFNTPRLARYIPGKLYEYMAAGATILCYGTGGEIGRLLEQYPRALVAGRGDPGALRAVLERLTGDASLPDRAAVASLARIHRRAGQAQAQVEILERLLEARANLPAGSAAASPPLS